jgi:hypothetical protein
MGNSQYAITIFEYCVHRETKKCSSLFMDLGKERSIQLDTSTEVWMLTPGVWILHLKPRYFGVWTLRLESGHLKGSLDLTAGRWVEKWRHNIFN